MSIVNCPEHGVQYPDYFPASCPICRQQKQDGTAPTPTRQPEAKRPEPGWYWVRRSGRDEEWSPGLVSVADNGDRWVSGWDVPYARPIAEWEVGPRIIPIQEQ